MALQLVSSHTNGLSLGNVDLARRFFMASVELATRERNDKILSVLHSYIIASSPSVISLSPPHSSTTSSGTAAAAGGTAAGGTAVNVGAQSEERGRAEERRRDSWESPLASACADVFDCVPSHLQECVQQAFGFVVGPAKSEQATTA
jgi:hypothetical protein